MTQDGTSEFSEIFCVCLKCGGRAEVSAGESDHDCDGTDCCGNGSPRLEIYCPKCKIIEIRY